MRLHRARWTGRNSIKLRFDPFAYRYIRLKVLARDGYACYWCGQAGYTMDHVIPWSKGGRTTMNNCICACEECNGLRGDMPAEEFARLRGVAPPKPEGGPPTPVRFEPLRRLAPPTPVTAGNTAVAVEIAVAAAPAREPVAAAAPRPHLVELQDASAVTRLLNAWAPTGWR